jgi:hypothetical protein
MWFIEIVRAAISTCLDPALLFLPKDAAISIEGKRSGETPVRNSFEAGQTIITVITSARTTLSTVILAEEMQVAKPSTCDSMSLCLKYSTFLGLACSSGCLDPRVDLIAEKHHHPFPESSRSVGPCFGMPKVEARRIFSRLSPASRGFQVLQ